MKAELAFEKLNFGEIEKCYSTLGLEIGGKPFLFYGGEGNGSMRVFSGENFENCDLIWNGGGGTMSIVPLPCHDGWLLASRGFTSMVDSAGSTIEIIRYRDGIFSHESIATLDYLHRFDTLLAPDGTRYIFAASLHGGKTDKNDWSKPGHMYFGAMPADVESSFHVELHQLSGDFYMNHGFCKGMWLGREAAFTASREGVFAFLPPEQAGGDWQMEQLLDFPVSDIAIADVDGDGVAEIAALLPFHGNQFQIFRQENGAYKEVYSHPTENDFYHAIISGVICGERMFAVGSRKGAAELCLIRWDEQIKAYQSQQIEAGPGPSNLAILNAKDGDYLLSANRMIFEAAAYRF